MIILAGVKTKCHMFVFRLSNSGKAVHRIYSTQSQGAFLQGHIDAFDTIGGVPMRHFRYDNLTSAVTFGRQREENARWLLFRSRYGFEAFHFEPGIAGAHEKSGGEGEGGRFRRNHLSPMPVVSSLAELTNGSGLGDEADDARRVNDRVRTVRQDFADEQPLLASVPQERFGAGD